MRMPRNVVATRSASGSTGGASPLTSRRPERASPGLAAQSGRSPVPEPSGLLGLVTGPGAGVPPVAAGPAEHAAGDPVVGEIRREPRPEPVVPEPGPGGVELRGALHGVRVATGDVEVAGGPERGVHRVRQQAVDCPGALVAR